MTRRSRMLLLVTLFVLIPVAGMGITYLAAPQLLMSLFVPPPPAPEPPPAPVKFTVEYSEIGVFMDHPVARKWLDQYFPGFRSSEQANLARRLTLPQAQPYFSDLITAAAIAKLKAELDPMPPLPAMVVYSTAQTTLGTILDDEQAKAIVDEYIPGFTSDSRIGMARPFTLTFIKIYIPDRITDEKLKAIDAEFEALADTRAEQVKL